MHRFTLLKGKESYTIDIDYIKMLIGDNELLKYEIYYQFKNYFNKIGNSICSVESSNKRTIQFDESQINLKEWSFIDINAFFDIESDMKLGTKSLINKYVNCFNDFLERSDLFNTLSILINSLNNDFFEPELDLRFGDKMLELRLGEISRPTIYKELIASITNDNLDCNSGDMNYEDLVLLQLALLNKISSKNRDIKIFAFCTFPILTKRIKEYVYGLKYENLFVVINSNDIIDLNIRDYCIVTKKHYLDMANDDMINDKIMEMPFHIEKDSFVKTVKTRILTDKLDPLDALNIELFSYKI